MAVDQDQERVSAAIYAGMVAYSKEARRLGVSPDRVHARSFKLAVDAYNAAMADDDAGEVIEDDN